MSKLSDFKKTVIQLSKLQGPSCGALKELMETPLRDASVKLIPLEDKFALYDIQNRLYDELTDEEKIEARAFSRDNPENPIGWTLEETKKICSGYLRSHSSA